MWCICGEVWVGWVRVDIWLGLVRINSVGTTGSQRKGGVDISSQVSGSFCRARWKIERIRVLRTGYHWR